MTNLAIQLDFDAIGLKEEELDDYFLKKEVEELCKQMHNVRKGIFARHNELLKTIHLQNEQIEALRIEVENLKKGGKNDTD